jgi:hypothetical protein
LAIARNIAGYKIASNIAITHFMFSGEKDVLKFIRPKGEGANRKLIIKNEHGSLGNLMFFSVVKL